MALDMISRGTEPQFHIEVGGGRANLDAGGGGEATHGAPLLHTIPQELGQHQRLLKVHQRLGARPLLQQPAAPEGAPVNAAASPPSVPGG